MGDALERIREIRQRNRDSIWCFIWVGCFAVTFAFSPELSIPFAALALFKFVSLFP
jgi:hypothetical protein